MKPIWIYGIQLWWYSSESNRFYIQRSEPKIRRAIGDPLWNVHTYTTIHCIRTSDFPIVSLLLSAKEPIDTT
nr:unnamed protein product [Callosobruchus chinensis]